MRVLSGNRFLIGQNIDGAYLQLTSLLPNFPISSQGRLQLALEPVEDKSKERILIDVTKFWDKSSNIIRIALKSEDLKDYFYYYLYDKEKYIDLASYHLIGKEKFNNGKSYKGSGFVLDEAFIPRDIKKPIINPYIYKLHIRNATMDKSCNIENRGSFLGVIERLNYIKKMGFNTIELMPCYEFNENYEAEDDKAKNIHSKTIIDELENKTVKKRRLPNCWGYCNAYYYAPKASYADVSENSYKELALLVDKAHELNIQIIMEFYFVGINKLRYIDILRYYVSNFNVDGFHINSDGMDLSIASNDLYLCNSWQISEYSQFVNGQLTDSLNFKRLCCHDGFEEVARRFVRGDTGSIMPLIDYLSGKYPNNINYTASHNGFTLFDSQAYSMKNNIANGFNNFDGKMENFSNNHGVEGLSRSSKVNDKRINDIKELLLLTHMAIGTPLVMAGDECCNSNKGNNNAFNQDNSIAYVQYSDNKWANDLRVYLEYLGILRTMFFNKRKLSGISEALHMPNLSFHSKEAWEGLSNPYSRCLGVFYGLEDSYNISLNELCDTLKPYRDISIEHIKFNKLKKCQALGLYLVLNSSEYEEKLALLRMPDNVEYISLLGDDIMELSSEQVTMVMKGKSYGLFLVVGNNPKKQRLIKNGKR